MDAGSWWQTDSTKPDNATGFEPPVAVAPLVLALRALSINQSLSGQCSNGPARK